MNGTVLKKISRAEVSRGDIFIVGTPGASHGSEGHTGIIGTESILIVMIHT
ncbi:peptidoglycan amidohydrolase family protein [Enterococcus gallinarum]|uniref:Bacteriophage lysin domain-containing protein n=1 Tax=Enterococcus gallinarum TaxID=1353 RepID=A0AAE7MQ57_ENTGA|nr:peptidoglycan amidohydrolase family protein [Enterococcus gallinarum]QOG27597.1 hypothetical protein EGM181_10200 [Enterococcus gallinarum]